MEFCILGMMKLCIQTLDKWWGIDHRQFSKLRWLSTPNLSKPKTIWGLLFGILDKNTIRYENHIKIIQKKSHFLKKKSLNFRGKNPSQKSSDAILARKFKCFKEITNILNLNFLRQKIFWNETFFLKVMENTET